MKKSGYPIKYAIMPIEAKVVWDDGKSNVVYRGVDPIYYIVSKVFLVGENLLYFNDGTSRKTLGVVYPYATMESINNERAIPKYGIDEFYANKKTVDNIYDNYEAAKKEAERLNNRLRGRLLGKSAADFEVNAAKYNEFEKLILMYTDDMKVEETPSSEFRIK